ncbi:MAG: hypothetical protein ABSE69_01035, partial [Roseiarcus sp.]
SLALTFSGDDHPYAATVAKVAAAFGARRANRSTSEYLAEGIDAAATDGTRQTRYVVGEDAVALARRAREDDRRAICRVHGEADGPRLT